MKTKTWKTAPISPTCEVLRGKGKMCDQATSFAYPAMGRGWMALCYKHGLKHKYAVDVIELIAAGEKWENLASRSRHNKGNRGVCGI